MKLIKLYISNQELINLPPVPLELLELDCSYNNLTLLSLPPKITKLDCSRNNLTLFGLPLEIFKNCNFRLIL